MKSHLRAYLYTVTTSTRTGHVQALEYNHGGGRGLHQKQMKHLHLQLKKHDIRAKLDSRSEKIGAKIRDAELLKVPYMFIVGKKEVEVDAVSVRRHGVGDIGVKKIDEAVEMLLKEVATKGLNASSTDD